MGSYLPLDEYITAIAIDDGSGITGTATSVTGPYRYGESWDIDLITTQVQSVKQSTLTIYRGIVSGTSIVGGTYSGNFDTATGGSVITLKDGEKLTFVWTGADIGADCQARIEGTLNSMRMGA